MTTPPPPCELLTWDSAHFGVRVGRVVGDRLDAEILARVRAFRDEHAVDCLYLLADAADAATAPLAEGAGFRLVDVRLTLEGAALSLKSRAATPLSTAIREARPDDVPALGRLAAVSHRDSRFYYDGRFDRTRCDELYSLWIEKACGGDTVWVATDGERPVGYISCRIENGCGQIGLFAVAEAARGRGLGGELIAQALDHFATRGASRVRVVTQGRNVRAQRIYQRFGLHTRSLELWFHVWREGAGRDQEGGPK